MKFLMCILLPPVGVAMKGGSGSALILNLILCCMGYVPGIIHALVISDKKNNQPNIVINNVVNK